MVHAEVSYSSDTQGSAKGISALINAGIQEYDKPIIDDTVYITKYLDLVGLSQRKQLHVTIACFFCSQLLFKSYAQQHGPSGYVIRNFESQSTMLSEGMRTFKRHLNSHFYLS